ncbi:hypothetical protein HOC67_04835, partial [Candidatus Peregrinibacteria bacterium]|nr:hypothetical protein [Candidatus Peregrinibacteria bacterium]
MNLVCIYCKREKPKDQFNKEHVLLSAFGNFPTKNSSPQLKKEVCTKCNQFFGDGIDNFFARQSFEGLKRLEYGN